MNASPNPETPNPEGFAAYNERLDEAGPVTMLNLLRFKPEGGRQRYLEYGAAVTPLLERIGARVAAVGEATLPLIGERGWDSVLLVEYPSRRAFLEMIGSPEYQEIAHLRSEALAEGELHPLTATDPGL